MIESLILHKATRQQLEAFISRPAHALLLTGPNGIGKTAIAEALVVALLGKSPYSHPYHLTIQPDGQSISIDAIRQLQKFLQLKTTGKAPLRRTIIVESAHRMTIEAQNAFLKLLEEPPHDTLLILTANNSRTMLPTILSRAQSIAVNMPSKEQLEPLLKSSHRDENSRNQAYFLSGGLPGLLHALLHEEDHPLLSHVSQAKEILSKEQFERLAAVDGLSRQKNDAVGVVEALERIAGAGLAAAASRQDTARIKQWHKVRKVALEAQDALQKNTNTKLVLTNLFITF